MSVNAYHGCIYIYALNIRKRYSTYGSANELIIEPNVAATLPNMKLVMRTFMIENICSATVGAAVGRSPSIIEYIDVI